MNRRQIVVHSFLPYRFMQLMEPKSLFLAPMGTSALGNFGILNYTPRDALLIQSRQELQRRSVLVHHLHVLLSQIRVSAIMTLGYINSRPVESVILSLLIIFRSFSRSPRRSSCSTVRKFALFGRPLFTVIGNGKTYTACYGVPRVLLRVVYCVFAGPWL